MLRRANDLVARARERIRAAAEHDPHAWPEHDDERTVLVYDDEPGSFAPEQAGSRTAGDQAGTDQAGTDPVGVPTGADPTGTGTTAPDGPAATSPPLGSPQPGTPDLDGALGAGGVSGPPREGRSHRPAERPHRLFGGDHRFTPDESVPASLRTAASWSWRLIVVVAGFWALLWAASYVAVVVVPVIVALLLAALLQPGAAGLVKRGWPRPLAALTMLVVGLGVVSGIITLVEVQDFVVRTFPITEGQLENAVEELQDALLDNRDTIATGAISTAATVGEVITGIVLALFTLFFFLKDGRSIWLWLVGLFPRDARAYLDEAARRSWRTLISYVRATVAVALVDAIGIGVGLAILGVPFVIPLAALVFLGAFIPIIGSFLAGSVAVLVALVSEGPITALIALAIVVGVMQLEGHVLQPLLLGRAVRVHPLAVVLAIAAGLLIAGIFGALIAVPIVACANVAGTYLSRRHEGPRPPEPRPERARPVVGTT
jgi:predicted PurR-regulated permease PerM